jgi:MFS family permease
MNNKSIRLMYAIALLQGMVFYAPVATLYRQAQGVSLFQITIIESISLFVMIALEIPWGFVADSIGYKKTLVICNALYFVSKIVFWQATGFAWFLAERLLLSVVQAGISGCDSAYLFIATGEKESRRVFGVYSAMGMAGLMIAAVVFSAVSADNYRLAAFLTVVSYGVSMALSFALGDPGIREVRRYCFASDFKAVISALRGNKRFFMFLIAAMLLAESNQTITVFLSQVQYVRAGIETKYMGYIYILITLAGLTAALSGRLVSHIGESRAGKMLFAAAAIACAATAFTTDPLLSVLLIMLLRLSASMFAPISMSIQNRQISIPARATLLSVYSCIMNAGAIFTNLMFGRLADISVSLALGTGAAFCIIGLILYSVWARKAA